MGHIAFSKIIKPKDIIEIENISERTFDMTYEDVEKLVENKNYNVLIIQFYGYIYEYYLYVSSSFYKNTGSHSAKLDALLKQMGSNSIKVFRNSYCKKERNEIMLDILYCFILIIDRYKKQDRNFVAYLTNVFCYEIARFMIKESKDMRTHAGETVHLDTVGELNLSDYKDNVDYNLEYIMGYETVDRCLTTNWTNNKFDDVDSCFSELTSMEKSIILDYYQNKIPDIRICEKYEMKRNTINKRRLKAKRKIESRLGLIAVRTRRIEIREGV